jgi:hypothetical protein
MKPFKLLLLTLVISVSTVIYAEGSKKIYDLNSLSAEIEHLLRDANQNLEEGNSITVFFSVSEEKSIQYVSVAAGKPEICNLLRKKLQSQKLDGTKWREGIIYELSIIGRSPAACLNH